MALASRFELTILDKGCPCTEAVAGDVLSHYYLGSWDVDEESICSLSVIISY